MMTASQAPVVARGHHAMMLDEEPGRRGASAIDSRCARGEGASLRVAERYKKSRWWMHTAIDSLWSNGPDDARRDDVPIDWVAGFYDEPRTTTFSVLARCGDRDVCLAQAERQMRGAVCGGLPGSSRSTQPDEVAHGYG